MAKEGSRLTVDGEGTRGGLLNKVSHYNYGWNSKQISISCTQSSKGRKYIEKLHDLGMLKKETIVSFDLLTCIFNVDGWDSNALKPTRLSHNGQPLKHGFGAYDNNKVV